MPVRPGTDADAAAAAELVRQVLREHGLPFEPTGLDADILAPEAHYAAGGGAFYVATDAGGRIVGTAALRRTGPASGEVRRVFLLVGSTRQPRGGLGLVYELDLAGQGTPDRPAGLPRRPLTPAFAA